MDRRPSRAVARWRQDRERGAGSVEYVGIVIAVAALVAVLLVALPSSSGSALADRAKQAICEITGGSGCGAGDRTASGDDARPGGREDSQTGATDGSDKSREDTGRDARDSRRDDARRADPTQGPGPSNPGNGPAIGLGTPVSGTSVPRPDPPAWQPVDAGAGAHNSEEAEFGDHLTKFAAEAAAHALSLTWPDAARNLLHFLSNSGEPLEQDVDRMLADVPKLNDEYTRRQDDLGQTAISQAQAAGATGPMTFPVSTDWRGFYITKGMSPNWFYATGGIQYSIVGQVTAYPPSAPGGDWTYETTTSMVYRDQYNWDGNKSTQIGPFNVTDQQLADLHLAGLAQEYTLTGESSVTTRKGP